MNDRPETTRAWAPALALTACFALAAAAIIFFGSTPERIRVDQNDYHLQAIRSFAQQWPRPDLHDYASATTPGYHLLMAGASGVVGDGERPLRLASLLISLPLVGLMAHWCVRRAGRPGAALMALPFACSPYVLASGAWLLPDNAAWLGVLGVLMFCWRGRVDGWFVAGGALVLAVLVLTRQIHLWTAAPLLAAAWIGNGASGDERPPLLSRIEFGLLLGEPRARVARAAAALVAATPAVALLAAFVSAWGGLVPPRFQTVLHGGNAATPAFVLSLLAIYGLALAPLLWDRLVELVRERPAVLLLALTAGAAVALVPATTYSVEDGRWTGLWQVAAQAPVIGGRTSVIILLLAPAGAVVAALIASGLNLRERWVWLAALAGFTLAQSANHACWQRYVEPALLMLVAMAGARLLADVNRSGVHRRVATAAPVALAVLLAAVASRTLFGP
ncbi:MAG: hypothetical protein JNJ48_08900 [Phycisphaerae bacterium]|nr:hypothetical protein [Phycisphaerae bacterium]